MQTKSNLSKRIIAGVLDYFVIYGFTTFLIFKYGQSDESGAYKIYGIKALIVPLFWFLYLVVIEYLLNASIGHFIMGLYVVKKNGEKISLVDSLKRHLLDPIDYFFLGIPAILSINKTEYHQRLGDLWADTIIINEKDFENVKNFPKE